MHHLYYNVFGQNFCLNTFLKLLRTVADLERFSFEILEVYAVGLKSFEK